MEKGKMKLTIIRNIKARDITKAMQIIRKKFPYSRMVSYKFQEDFKFHRPKDYTNRRMDVAIFKDVRKIKWKRTK